MSSILLHYCLTLDLGGYADIDGTITHFLEQAGLSNVQKTIETMDSHCIIRFTREGPETLAELRQTFKDMAKGLFSESTREALKTLKERPSDIYLAVSVRPPLFGLAEDGNRASV
jgi:hypothetical protein